MCLVSCSSWRIPSLILVILSPKNSRLPHQSYVVRVRMHSLAGPLDATLSTVLRSWRVGIYCTPHRGVDRTATCCHWFLFVTPFRGRRMGPACRCSPIACIIYVLHWVHVDADVHSLIIQLFRLASLLDGIHGWSIGHTLNFDASVAEICT